MDRPALRLATFRTPPAAPATLAVLDPRRKLAASISEAEAHEVEGDHTACASVTAVFAPTLVRAWWSERMLE
jgi:hypothetical protein